MAWHQNLLWIGGGEIELASERLYIRQVNVCLSDHRNFLARAVDARLVERRDIVNGRQVVGSDAMTAAAGGHLRIDLPPYAPGLEAKVVQTPESPHNAVESGWNRGAARVRIVQLAVNVVAMNPGAEGA